MEKPEGPPMTEIEGRKELPDQPGVWFRGKDFWMACDPMMGRVCFLRRITAHGYLDSELSIDNATRGGWLRCSAVAEREERELRDATEQRLVAERELAEVKEREAEAKRCLTEILGLCDATASWDTIAGVVEARVEQASAAVRERSNGPR